MDASQQSEPSPSVAQDPLHDSETPAEQSLRPPQNLGRVPPVVPPFRDFPLGPVPPTQPCGLRPRIRRRAPGVALPSLALAPLPPPIEEDDDVNGSHVRTMQRLRSRANWWGGAATPDVSVPSELRGPGPPLPRVQPTAPVDPRPARCRSSQSHSFRVPQGSVDETQSASAGNRRAPMNPPRAATTSPQPWSFREPALLGTGMPRAPAMPRATSVRGRSWRHRHFNPGLSDEITEAAQQHADVQSKDAAQKTVAAKVGQEQVTEIHTKMEDRNESEKQREEEKRRAILALQKFFFDEVARGGSPNGSAARALLRLNADAAPIQEDDFEQKPTTDASTTAEKDDQGPTDQQTPVPLRPSPAFRGPQGRNAIRVSNYI